MWQTQIFAKNLPEQLKKKNDSTTPLIEGPKCGIRGTVVIPFRLKLPSGNQSEGTKMEANSRKNKCFREERIV